ncbi:hypothetical protein Q7P37_004115 [Cladosporium fusiforme]
MLANNTATSSPPLEPTYRETTETTHANIDDQCTLVYRARQSGSEIYCDTSNGRAAIKGLRVGLRWRIRAHWLCKLDILLDIGLTARWNHAAAHRLDEPGEEVRNAAEATCVGRVGGRGHITVSI